MRTLEAATIYFLVVFSIAFALGVVRVTMLEPALEQRHAELTTAPVMIAVIILAARSLVR